LPDPALDLDGYFGLHPALGDLTPLYRAGELLFVPAAATRYRDRSHFDGQNMLENGIGKPYGAQDGWLEKAAAQQPFGRLVDPKEVARAVAFLSSEESGLMTGSMINFDQSIWGAYEGSPQPSKAMAV